MSSPDSVAVADASDALEKVKVEGDASNANNDDVVDPWNVQTSSDKGVDYDKLVSESTTNTVSSFAAATKI